MQLSTILIQIALTIPFFPLAFAAPLLSGDLSLPRPPIARSFRTPIAPPPPTLPLPPISPLPPLPARAPTNINSDGITLRHVMGSLGPTLRSLEKSRRRRIVGRDLVPGGIIEDTESKALSLPNVDQAEGGSTSVLGLVDHTGNGDIQTQDRKVAIGHGGTVDILGLAHSGGSTAVDASTARDLVTRQDLNSVISTLLDILGLDVGGSGGGDNLPLANAV